MRLKLLLFPLLIFISTFNLKATHIVGGEMNYKFLGTTLTGNNIYEIRLTMYRDCWVGVPPFDNPAVMGIFDINNNFIDSVWLPFLGLDTLPPTINDPCFVPPTDFCYEVTTYIDTINLPPITGGYILSYQRCCRNQNLLNIVSPTCAGATYWAHIPGPDVVTIDSNPVFKNWPPPFICANKPWVFDHSATDYDGDSLAYELWTPYTGLDAACPVVTTTAISPSATSCFPTANPCPSLPVPPPFQNVVWNTTNGYSLSNVLGGVPLTIDPITGIVTATPSTLGYFVYGVRCKQYRNGVQIGETMRDFQLIVKDCPLIVVAAATVPDAVCGTNTVNFTNTSQGAGTYTWTFGDPTTLADTSNVYSPTYTYPDTGMYTVQLVAYAPNKPACNDTVITTVSLSDNYNGSFSFYAEPCINNKLYFTATVNAPSGTTPTYLWDFGNGPSDTAQHTIQNPTHIYPNTSGSYQVTLITGIPGSINCYDTIQAQTVTIGAAGQLFVPNTFTPNNDGKNDIFRVRGPAYHKFYFAVYNRWGQLLWETNNPADGWDGTFNGMQSDPGVFGWYLRASCGEGTDELFKKGNVTLIR